MSKQESIDQTLDNIVEAGYLAEQERLVSCARMIMARAGVHRSGGWLGDWFATNRDGQVHHIRKNQQVDYLKRSRSIALDPYYADELNLGATAVMLGYSEQWYDCSFTDACFFRTAQTVSWLIWPLTRGESDTDPYRVEEASIGFTVYDQSELKDNLRFDMLERFAEVVDVIEDTYGDLRLPSRR